MGKKHGREKKSKAREETTPRPAPTLRIPYAQLLVASSGHGAEDLAKVHRHELSHALVEDLAVLVKNHVVRVAVKLLERELARVLLVDLANCALQVAPNLHRPLSVHDLVALEGLDHELALGHGATPWLLSCTVLRNVVRDGVNVCGRGNGGWGEGERAKGGGP